MNSNILIDAIGEIDDEFLLEARRSDSKERKIHFVNLHPAAVAAAAIFVVFTLVSVSAYAFGLFSPLSGDEFSLSSEYKGDGIVEITVENYSDKDIIFENKLKLFKWKNSEEIPLDSDRLKYDNLTIHPNSSGVLRIDISEACDVAELEKSLDPGDWYYFVLTNQAFLFGHDWMCDVSFSNNSMDSLMEISETEIDKEERYEYPISGEQIASIADIEEELKPYFDTFIPQPSLGVQSRSEYYQKVEELLSGFNGHIVYPSQYDYAIDAVGYEKQFDSDISKDLQHIMTTENFFPIDGLNHPIGASEMDNALVCGVCIPQYKGDDEDGGGAGIPIAYYIAYPAEYSGSDRDYAFIHGQIISFQDLDDYAICQIDENTIYNITNFIYTDIDEYVKVITDNMPVYFDNRIWKRIYNVRDFYNDKAALKSRIYSIIPQMRYDTSVSDKDTASDHSFSDDAPVDESSYSEAREYSSVIMDLQERISHDMGPGNELYFVTSSMILENPDRIHVFVNTMDQECINLLNSYNTDNVTLEIEYSTDVGVEE